MAKSKAQTVVLPNFLCIEYNGRQFITTNENLESTSTNIVIDNELKVIEKSKCTQWENIQAANQVEAANIFHNKVNAL